MSINDVLWQSMFIVKISSLINLFPFAPSKAKLIGDFSINSQNIANCSLRFPFLVCCVMDGDREGDGETEKAEKTEIKR